jgi:hypothetical protein
MTGARQESNSQQQAQQGAGAAQQPHIPHVATLSSLPHSSVFQPAPNNVAAIIAGGPQVVNSFAAFSAPLPNAAPQAQEGGPGSESRSQRLAAAAERGRAARAAAGPIPNNGGRY